MNKILIEQSSLCGCPENMTSEGESCISNYQSEPKEILLNYTLRGKQYELNFTAYKGLVDYLSQLTPYISSNGTYDVPSRMDFKLKDINNQEQRDLLLPLIVEIQNRAQNREDQVRIATSIVQNLEWGSTNKTILFFGNKVPYQRHPYEVLYDSEGLCGEKSELLAFLLKEMGFGTVIFYNEQENHESVGIKCPVEQSWHGTGYCFIETTGSAIMTDSSIIYTNGLTLSTIPLVLPISDGDSLNGDLYEYKDAKTFGEIRNNLNNSFFFNPIKFWTLNDLEKKYGLTKSYEAG
jgi:hypothetical protein